jgi:beta-glucosidase
LSQKSIKKGEGVNISLEVKNTGNLNGDEVVQIYVKYPDSGVDRPQKELKGFTRVYIPSGESKVVNISLEANELRYWNKEKHAFMLEKGNVELMIGASSEDIRLTSIIEAK